MRYKFENAHDWLIFKAQSWDADQLRSELFAIAYRLDCDTLQDIYQSDMDADGYFDDLDDAEEVS